MNKNFLNKYIVLGIVLIAISFAVHGTAITILKTNWSVEGDCFAPVLKQFTLKNETVEKNYYTIKAVDAYKDWINLNGKWIGKKGEELKFALEAGEKKELYAFIKPPCNTVPGLYNVAIRIRSGKEEVTKLIHFKVLESRKVIVSLEENHKEVGQCTAAEFNVNVTNNSKAKEVIQVIVQGLPEKWVTNVEEFLLEHGASVAKKIGVIAPCDAETRDYEFEVIARIKGTNFEDKASALLTIKDTQPISIIAKDWFVCNDLVESREFTIKNDGEKVDQLKVALIDVNNAELSENSFELGPGEDKKLLITFNTEKELVGKDEFIIKVSSEKFAKKKEKLISVYRENCYDLEVIGPSHSITMTAGKEEVDVIKVKNIGTRENNVELSVEANPWISSIPKKGTLKSGEEMEFYLYLNPPLDLEQGTYEEKVTIKGDDFIQYKKLSVYVLSPLKVEIDTGGVKIESDLDNIEEKTTQKVTVTVKLFNEGNNNILVKSITAKNYNAEFNPKEFMINSNSEKKVKMTLLLDKKTEGKITVPLILKTSDGKTLEKEIVVDIAGTTVTSIGLFGLSIDTMTLASGIVITIIAIIVLGFYILQKKKSMKKR